MASGSRKLGPPGRFDPLAELLLIHPENLGTFGSFRISLEISMRSPLMPWYFILVGLSFSSKKGVVTILSLTFFFPRISKARSAPNFKGSEIVSGIIRNNSISCLVSSSHKNLYHRYFWIAPRDPCEYTRKFSFVPFSRLVETVILMVL